MGEFDLGEEQAGEGGEGFMDLGAAIGNKVGYMTASFCKACLTGRMQLYCPNISISMSQSPKSHSIEQMAYLCMMQRVHVPVLNNACRSV